jgi:hypothetical protein
LRNFPARAESLTMNEQQLEKYFKILNDGLSSLLVKLQLSAEKLFEWGIRKNYAEAYTDLFTILICAAAVWFGVRLLWKRVGEEYVEFLVVLSCIVALFAVPICISVGHDAIMRFVAPEYMTLQDFVKLVNGK